jgi:4-hydroxybenzoate polyprenyltransferase
MIQRKQSVFLLVAVIIGLVFFLDWPLFVVQVLASAVSCYTIFIYKNRPRQAALCLVSIFGYLAWYIVLAVLIQQGRLSENIPWEACLPIIAAILCFMARKAIIADEKLVRAADRIR